MGVTLKNGFGVPIAAAVPNTGAAALLNINGFNRKLFIMPYTSFTVVKVGESATATFQAVPQKAAGLVRTHLRK